MSSQVTPINEVVGANIRAAREERHLTQRQLGTLVNDTDGNAVSRWERGAHRPSDENLVLLSRALDREIAWFYRDHSVDTQEAA